MLLKHREAKLADVGLSQMLRNSLVNSLKGMGTFCWAALEVLAGTHKARPKPACRAGGCCSCSMLLVVICCQSPLMPADGKSIQSSEGRGVQSAVGAMQCMHAGRMAGCGVQITEKADIYSFGVLVWEVCTGEQPTSRYLRDLAPDEAPPSVRELFRACVLEDPGARPSAKEVLEVLQRSS